MESGINCGLCCPNAWLHLLVIGFEDSSLVQFLPSIVGFHWSFLSWASRNRSPLPNGQIRFKGEKQLRFRIKPDEGESSRFGFARDVASVFARNRHPKGAAEGCEK